MAPAPIRYVQHFEKEPDRKHFRKFIFLVCIIVEKTPNYTTYLDAAFNVQL
jgi:hypothetical protein